MVGLLMGALSNFAAIVTFVSLQATANAADSVSPLAVAGGPVARLAMVRCTMTSLAVARLAVSLLLVAMLAVTASSVASYTMSALPVLVMAGFGVITSHVVSLMDTVPLTAVSSVLGDMLSVTNVAAGLLGGMALADMPVLTMGMTIGVDLPMGLLLGDTPTTTALATHPAMALPTGLLVTGSRVTTGCSGMVADTGTDSAMDHLGGAMVPASDVGHLCALVAVRVGAAMRVSDMGITVATVTTMGDGSFAG